MDCSPETWSTSDGPGAHRGWCRGSPRGKRKTQLDVPDQGEVVCVNEKARSGLFLPGSFAGEEGRCGGARRLVVVDALGRPRLNKRYGQKRLRLGNVCARSGRHGGGWFRRNSSKGSSEQ